LMIKLAKCCNPEKPDAIIGYVTRDRGITLHRQGCAFMQRVPEDRRDRMLNAVWAGGGGRENAYDRFQEGNQRVRWAASCKRVFLLGRKRTSLLGANNRPFGIYTLNRITDTLSRQFASSANKRACKPCKF
ncbi:MAG: hypothetical protein Q8O58_01915, partial [Gallionella sp.]|nr:hypothetical protein [Gallionella sp.]